MSDLAVTNSKPNSHSKTNALRELTAIELDQVSGGQSTESILDRKPILN
jgi:hypothetical protein